MSRIGARYGTLALLAALAAGCGGLRVIERTPPAAPVGALAGLPSDETVAVEKPRLLSDEWGDVGAHKDGLTDALREARVFRRVWASGEQAFDSDLIIRARVEGHFEYSGGANFATWFPGPILLAHNWRGNRYEYVLSGEVTLVDARSETTTATYPVASRHQLIHESGNPFPIFGVVLIFPGIIKGAKSASPRPKYRTLLYEQAYKDLWQQAVARISVDRAALSQERRDERIARCGQRLNHAPEIGEDWAGFVACQARHFHAQQARDTPEGAATIYADGDGKLEIEVLDGRIVRWTTPEPLIRRGPPPN